MSSLVNTEVKPFKATAFHNGKFVDVSEASLKGKWSVVIFMPAAFTFTLRSLLIEIFVFVEEDIGKKSVHLKVIII